MHTTLLQSSVN